MNSYEKRFHNKVANLLPEYRILGQYKSSKERIEILHIKCGTKFLVRPDLLVQKSKATRCPLCTKGSSTKPNNWFRKEVDKLYPDGEYKVLEDLDKRSSRRKILHSKCNTIFKVSADNFLGGAKKKGTRCPFCTSGSNQPSKLNDNYLQKKLDLKYGKKFEVVSEYISTHEKVKIKHIKCGNTFEVSATHILYTGNCSYCSKIEQISCGERSIIKWLDYNNIDYDFQFSDKKICELTKNPKYTFDFKVNYDDGSYHLIEFYGELHYRPWRGKSRSAAKKFKNTQKSDLIKQNSCNELGIPLCIISYKEMRNIDTILNELLLE